MRASRRDLGPALVRGRTGGTTVSASMFIAHRAGIRLLATGAIGGAAHTVPNSDENPWDVSADLVELFQTPVAVVSAGTRSVYNKAYTAEVLETFRIPVIGYGTDAFPTFFMALELIPHRLGRTPRPMSPRCSRYTGRWMAQALSWRSQPRLTPLYHPMNLFPHCSRLKSRPPKMVWHARICRPS